MDYIIHYDVAATWIAITMVVHFLNKRRIRTAQTRAFFLMLWFNLASCLLDITMVKIELFHPPVWAGYIGNMAYLLAFNTIPAIYLFYLLSMIKKREKWSRQEKILIFLPVIVSYFLILTTPLTKLIFSYDAVNRYVHGPLFSLLYGIAMLYLLLSLYLSIRYRSRLTYGQRVSVVFYNVSCMLAVVIQIIYSNILILQFVLSVSLMLASLSLENTRDDEDNTFGIYSRSGFIKRGNVAIDEKKEFHVLGVNIIGYSNIREMLGVEQSNLFVKQIIETLIPKIRPMYMFVVSQGQFTLFTDDKSLDLNRIIENIYAEFEAPILFAGTKIDVDVYLYRLDYPDNVQTMEDILDIIDFSKETASAHIEKDIMRASEEILQKKRQENHIDHLLQTAVREKRLEVYYQPVYATETRHIVSAEALLRLRDEDGSFISPEIFIPMAEKNGRIIEIGEFVFREVCKMLAKERPWEQGLKFIEVNLSVIQCMQKDLHERLTAIMRETGISPKFINLEITETATADSKDTLRGNMEPLIAEGVTFSLDDYGTGYSNTAGLLMYPFSIIKIDKSVLWYAMEDERAMRALRHTAAMLKDLDLHIVVEGVETKEQLEYLTEIGCNYVQGFYFSKPVPLGLFLDLLNADGSDGMKQE